MGNRNEFDDCENDHKIFNVVFSEFFYILYGDCFPNKFDTSHI